MEIASENLGKFTTSRNKNYLPCATGMRPKKKPQNSGIFYSLT